MRETGAERSGPAEGSSGVEERAGRASGPRRTKEGPSGTPRLLVAGPLPRALAPGDDEVVDIVGRRRRRGDRRGRLSREARPGACSGGARPCGLRKTLNIKEGDRGPAGRAAEDPQHQKGPEARAGEAPACQPSTWHCTTSLAYYLKTTHC